MNSKAKIPRVELILVDRVNPNPYQPRERIEEGLEELAMSIREVGLIQPVLVRPKGRRYEVIAGERRLRACRKAGLKEAPAIVKDVDDARLLVESLVENVHRKELEPIERGRSLAKLYELAEGLNPSEAATKLGAIKNKLERGEALDPSLAKVKRTADLVSLSYDYQYRLLSQLRLTPEELKRVSELGLGYEKIASIASVEDVEARRVLIEKAPEMGTAEVKKAVKVVKEAPEEIKEAVLRVGLEPMAAEEIMKVGEPELRREVLKRVEVEGEKVTPERVKAIKEDIEIMKKVDVMKPPPFERRPSDAMYELEKSLLAVVNLVRTSYPEEVRRFYWRTAFKEMRLDTLERLRGMVRMCIGALEAFKEALEFEITLRREGSAGA